MRRWARLGGLLVAAGQRTAALRETVHLGEARLGSGPEPRSATAAVPPAAVGRDPGARGSLEAKAPSAAIAVCGADAKGERVGCRTDCQCWWAEQCYPKFPVSRDAANATGGRHQEQLDVGICGTALAILGFLSLLLFSAALLCVVALRIIFQWRERVEELRWRSEKALVRSQAPSFAGSESEDEFCADAVADGRVLVEAFEAAGAASAEAESPDVALAAASGALEVTEESAAPAEGAPPPLGDAAT